jgi:hypothetical protein
LVRSHSNNPNYIIFPFTVSNQIEFLVRSQLKYGKKLNDWGILVFFFSFFVMEGGGKTKKKKLKIKRDKYYFGG